MTLVFSEMPLNKYIHLNQSARGAGKGFKQYSLEFWICFIFQMTHCFAFVFAIAFSFLAFAKSSLVTFSFFISSLLAVARRELVEMS